MTVATQHNEQKATALNDIHRIYFIGIGGIGMSAIARYFRSKGAAVSGYDNRRTSLTQTLEQEDIQVHYDEDVSLIPHQPDLVVYTPAIDPQQSELSFCRQQHFQVVKRSDVLQWITEQSFNICIGGSHGKTSISTMTGHILRHTGFGCNAFLGGISVNYNSNFWSSDAQNCVIEADEYDRSFLKLSPNVAVITAMDADHLDIYGTAEELEDAYIQFASSVKPGGCLISKYGLDRDADLSAPHHLKYSLDDSKADVYATSIQVIDGSYTFDVQYQGTLYRGFKLSIGGLHNIENMVAAVAVAFYIGLPADKVKAAVQDFKGVKRRFEYYLKNEQHILIDDYAHHPEEIAAFIRGVRSLYNTPLTMVFQPHLYSRTSDMAAAFALALDKADEVILLPIYPAREAPMKGVTSELILDKMQLENKCIQTKENLLDKIKKEKPKLLAFCGAGDITELLIPVKEILSQD